MLQAAAAATEEGSAQKKSKNHGRMKCRWWRCLSLTHPYSVSASLVVCRCTQADGQQKNIKPADRKTKWSAIATQLCEAVLTQQVSHTDCASHCIWLILSVCHVACASRLCLTLHLSYIAFVHIQAAAAVPEHEYVHDKCKGVLALVSAPSLTGTRTHPPVRPLTICSAPQSKRYERASSGSRNVSTRVRRSAGDATRFL